MTYDMDFSGISDINISSRITVNTAVRFLSSSDRGSHYLAVSCAEQQNLLKIST